MRGLTEEAATVAIDVASRVLHLPTVRASADELAAAAARDRLTHRAYLAELLSSEVETRDARRRERRIAEARFPRTKRLADFDLGATPTIAPATLAALAAGAWISAGEPVVLLGDSGTGKTHLLIGLGIAACEQGLRVRYVTAAALVNELVEAADERELSKVVARYGRLDLLCLDELGYLHLRPPGCRAPLPGPHRARRAGLDRGRLERALQRVGPDVHRPAARRRGRRPPHVPGPHPRDGSSSYRLRTSQAKRKEGPRTA